MNRNESGALGMVNVQEHPMKVGSVQRILATTLRIIHSGIGSINREPVPSLHVFLEYPPKRIREYTGRFRSILSYSNTFYKNIIQNGCPKGQSIVTSLHLDFFI